MRRKPGQLLDLEVRVLTVAIESSDEGNPSEVHGFGLAARIADHENSQRLTSHGTLYKALARLEDAGLLTSRWEDHLVAEEAGRPRRRLYRVTGSGRAALARHHAGQSDLRLVAGHHGIGLEPA